MIGSCAACGREASLSFHHLIPRSQHHRTWFRARFTREEMAAGVDVCADCHGAFHRFVSERDLGREYNTLEALLAHPEIGRFVAWVGSQDGRNRTRTPRRR